MSVCPSRPRPAKTCSPRFADADHRLFADHLTAKYRVRTEPRGRVVDEWKLRAGSPDNHAPSPKRLWRACALKCVGDWFDSLVRCAVAA